MPTPAQPPRHLLRWIALAVLALVLAALAALAIHIHTLLQPARFTTLLENDLAAAGLRLSMSAPAEPTLFPHPGVQLQGFSLTNIGSRRPVLQANGATIVVPWRALLHGDVAIERVDVAAPRIDLGELEGLLARLPHHTGPPRLPTITTGIHMSRGTLSRNGSPLLFDFSLATGALAPGQRFQLETSARSAAGRRLSASISTVPSAVHEGVIDFDALRIAIAGQHGTALQLDGKGSWRGGENLALHLQGTLRHRAFAPPPAASVAGASASAASSANAAPSDQNVADKIAIEVTPARHDVPMAVALKLDGVDAHADLRLLPTEFGKWWTRVLAAKPGQPAAALPFTGTVQARRLDLGWLQATGLSIDAGADLAPASAASVAPASSASVAR